MKKQHQAEGDRENAIREDAKYLGWSAGLIVFTDLGVLEGFAVVDAVANIIRQRCI